MSKALVHSAFHEVLFPSDISNALDETAEFRLRRLKRYVPTLDFALVKGPIVVFDLETTGLDYDRDRIIEIGAIKISAFEPIAEFSSLVSAEVELTDEIVRLTGITPDMLEGQPEIGDVLEQFLAFIEGSVLVAHNAEFDLNMITRAFSRIGIDLDWPCFCTLKMAREILPDLENKKLDTIAEYYDLKFEARHRSIGDVKVTTGILKGMLTCEGRKYKSWADIQPFKADIKV